MKSRALPFLVSMIRAEDALPGIQNSTNQSSNDIKTFENIVIDLSYDDSTGFYTIPAFFGDNQQGGEDSKFLIDMISPFVAITEVDCDNCSDNGGGIFDPATSSTFQ